MRPPLIAVAVLTIATGCAAGRVDPAPKPAIAYGGSIDLGDTVFVMRSDAFQVITRHRDNAPDPSPLLRAVAEYTRLFDAAPQNVMMVIGGDSTGAFPILPRDTVVLSTSDGTTASDSTSTDSIDTRRMAFGLALAWVRAAVDKADASADHAEIPLWFARGVALAVTFPDVNWATMLTETNTFVTVAQVLAEGAGTSGTTSGDVRGAALVAYLHDRDPALLASLPRLIANRVPITTTLLRSGALPHDVDALEEDFRGWYERKQ